MKADFDPKQFMYLHPLTWDEVFSQWEEIEKQSTFMQTMWKDRGYFSWREWRYEYAIRFRLEELLWGLHTVLKPLKSVPLFFGGPFKSWVEFVYGGLKNPCFKELIELQIIKDLKRIHYLVEDFPKETFIIAVEVAGRITIVEGMHRCLALALAAKEKREVRTVVHIALAKHPDSVLPIVGQQVKNQFDEK